MLQNVTVTTFSSSGIVHKRSRQSLRLADVGMDHPRAPDIAVVLRSSDTVNGAGYTGTTRHDSKYPEGGGLHGGLHPIELNNWLAVQGDAFAAGRVLDAPAGIMDVLPTLLHVLGLPVPNTVQGRILYEAMVDGSDRAPPAMTEKTVTAEGEAGYRASLSVARVGTARYLQGAWVM